MTALSFTTVGDYQVATFSATNGSVVQLQLEDTKSPVSVCVFTRIDSTLEWKLVKKSYPAPLEFMFQNDLPDGMLMKIEVSGNVTSGGIF